MAHGSTRGEGAQLSDSQLSTLRPSTSTLNSQLPTLNSQLATPPNSRLATRDSRLATRDSRLTALNSQRLSKVLNSTRRHGTGLAETLTWLDGTTTELDSRLTRFATRRTALGSADSIRLASSSAACGHDTRAWPCHKPGGEVSGRFLKCASLLQTATSGYILRLYEIIY